MKQFKTILSFELKNYFKEKSYIGTIVFFVLAILIGLSIPRISVMFHDKDANQSPVINIVCNSEVKSKLYTMLEKYEINELYLSYEEAVKAVKNNEYKHIVYVTDNQYQYIVQNYNLSDTILQELNNIIKYNKSSSLLQSAGIDKSTINAILNPADTVELNVVGKNQTNNFLYTYAYVVIIYMIVLMFGVMVATNVASEKSSRAMEMLITSADSNIFISAKVIATTIIATFTLIMLLASSILGYKFNKEYYIDNMFVQSMFAIPLDIAAYAILFFVLGFTMYASMYAALGSTVSKVEDVNKVIGPFTIIFVIGYFIVMQGIVTGNVDSTLMKFIGIFPFTSPIAMFARISMGNVSTMEIILSVIVLAVTSLLMLKLDSKIYRMGVLMYGQTPSLKNIIKVIRQK